MEGKNGSSDGEDIPSDFFDDFTKDEFIEGLNVIDSWDSEDKNPKNSLADTLDGVRDLRELIARDRKEEDIRKNDSTDRNSSRNQSHLDDFISPGSRRDPSKTQEAIKKDKELKVKEYLAKHLESSDDLRPPGTELDDFYEDTKSMKKKKKELVEQLSLENKLSQERRTSPRKYRRDPPKYSPPERRPYPKHPNLRGRYIDHSAKFHNPSGRFYENPKRYRESPDRFRKSPDRFRKSPERFRDSQGRHREVYGRRHESPTRPDRRMFPGPHRSPKPYRYMHPRREINHRSRSPQQFPGYRKDKRYSSPHSSPSRTRRDRSSKSPEKQYRRSYSRSPRKKTKDDFLYPDNIPTPNFANNPGFEMEHQPQYPGPMPINYYPQGSVVPPAGGPVVVAQSYNLPPAPAYTGYSVPFEYANQPPVVMHPPQPVPAPLYPAINNPAVGPVLQSPQLIAPVSTKTINPKIGNSVEPTDALAKLVADGILSHEDYLKLAPNKGIVQQMDTSTRVGVLNRCHSAISKLGDLMPPNRLLLDNIKKDGSLKSIQPKFCSPLKKNPTVEFNFTKICSTSNALQNKWIIDSIVSTLELHKIVGRPKKNLPNNVRHVAVQTSNPQCDVCVIRKATLVNEVGTSIDPEHFSSSTHTQVVDEDLQSSKSVFVPSGSASSGAPMSFAHMTPAQLVSQLEARAKTFKQSEAQANRFDMRGNYDGTGNKSNYRNNYSNYRY